MEYYKFQNKTSEEIAKIYEEKYSQFDPQEMLEEFLQSNKISNSPPFSLIQKEIFNRESVLKEILNNDEISRIPLYDGFNKDTENLFYKLFRKNVKSLVQGYKNVMIWWKYKQISTDKAIYTLRRIIMKRRMLCSFLEESLENDYKEFKKFYKPKKSPIHVPIEFYIKEFRENNLEKFKEMYPPDKFKEFYPNSNESKVDNQQFLEESEYDSETDDDSNEFIEFRPDQETIDAFYEKKEFEYQEIIEAMLDPEFYKELYNIKQLLNKISYIPSFIVDSEEYIPSFFKDFIFN